jgi:hypothetical protein
MLKFASDYDIRSSTEYLKSERGFRQDIDLRLDALEQQSRTIETASREVVDRAVLLIEQQVVPAATQILALLAEIRTEGVPAALVVESTDREFLTASRRAAIIDDLRGGVVAAADTLAKLHAILVQHDGLLDQRLRLDAAGSYTQAQQLQGLTNLGIADLSRTVFSKADPWSVAFVRTAAGAVSLKAGTVIELGGILYPFAAQAAVQMPTLAAGTDYAIYLCSDGTLRADASFTAPTGFTTTTSRRIGGFHYAPGGNATAIAGGNATPQINPYSLWDLKFRPACDDPRGMTLVDGWFWSCIYLLGVNHIADGASRYGVFIADGAAPPKIPLTRGGNGTTTYATLTWWEAAEVLGTHGLRLPSAAEFQALAFGVTEGWAAGADPGTTFLQTPNTSRWGIMQATGAMWIWGSDFGGGAAAAGWVGNTGGRGQTYQQENVARFGGSWDAAESAGSRSAIWSAQPNVSHPTVGARGCCSHLCHV